MLVSTVQDIRYVLGSVVHAAALLMLFRAVVLVFVMPRMLLLLLLRLLSCRLRLLGCCLRLLSDRLLLRRSRCGSVLTMGRCHLLFFEDFYY